MVDDRAFMARALTLAERGRGRTSPNPMVGAIVVDDEGIVVGRGAHEFAGGAHAEIHALADAGDRARGATLYCTLEPCSHVGRTGPCAPRVVDAGIRRAVVAVEDPNPRVSGRGFEHLRAHGVEVTVGVLREEAERQNRAFFTLMRLGRPYVTLKAAVSLDGRVAAAPGVRTAITGADAGRTIHRERAEIDALAVGSGTLLVDDPVLTARGAYRHRPLVRVIFDRRLRTAPTARVLSTLAHGPVVVITGAIGDDDRLRRADALRRAGADLMVTASSDRALSIQEALSMLGARGVTSLLVEGGPTLQQAFWDAAVVDRVEVFVAPRPLGRDGVAWALADASIARLDDVSARPIGEDVLIEGYVHRID
ncbi:MAG TPA: bifunctional diaminohydroxyphosphoribosylaminopyrimidine deaminase/5-amino-6-(5-phosphoribosylamino)uracil reductase RibD [Vicinamibacterales bacterium]|nr:bifunctional diaminohydroxyphosphoribosylaminopyrimidine deaminase/5-amino-6-(5-phosphoribosylamino)uracil reductase RibD [Vicinamibacterales bacterium]